ALEHESATTLFEGSGDSIPLVDQLYRESAPATQPPAGQKSSGESSSMVPFGPIDLGAPTELATPKASVALVSFESTDSADERITNASRNDASQETHQASQSTNSILKSLSIALIPLLSTMMFTEARRPKPIVSRWLRHVLFKPRTREGVS